MKKVLYLKDIQGLINTLKRTGEKIILVGGCFDILHSGHIAFLRNAKKHGAKLIVFLESDENVKKLKGDKRPIHKQLERARILSSVRYVDYIILLSEMKNAQDYAKLIGQIKPSVIATTNDDPYIKEKREQAGAVGAKLVEVIKRIEGKSTTNLAKLIK